MLIGEIKSLSTGVLTMETDYSDSDFKIEFDKVSEINVVRSYTIMLTGGRRRYGRLVTDEPGKLRIVKADQTEEVVSLNEIVVLQEVESKFWKRFSGSIDFSYNLTRANNSNQFTIGGQAGFVGEKWILDFRFNLLRTAQDNVEDVERSDGAIDVTRILGRRWYLLANTNYLSNTEQALKSRISPTLGGGRFLAATNKLFWGAALGLTYNIEKYDDPSLDKTSAELFLNTSLNMFDIRDFSLVSSLKIYPSLSERGRLRTDFELNTKYDLPLDFYIKLGVTVNYDNQPAVAGSDLDYVITSGFGWEFNK